MDARVIDSTRCYECSAPAEVEHHVVPRSRGGTMTVPLCGRCHGRAHHTDRNMATGAITRDAMLRRRDAGQPVGRAIKSPPYGWKWYGPRASRYLRPDEADRRRVAQLGVFRDEGLSLEGISRKALLADHRWLSEGGRKWYPMSVSSALKAMEEGFPPKHSRSSGSTNYRVWVDGKVRRMGDVPCWRPILAADAPLAPPRPEHASTPTGLPPDGDGPVIAR